MKRIAAIGAVILVSAMGGPVCGGSPYDYWVTDLGVLCPSTNTWVEAMNSAGQVVGYAPTSSGSYHAFLYSNGSMADLGTLSGFPTSYAYGVNDNGLVVGGSISAGGVTDAFLYNNGTMTNLGSGTAYGINLSGQVVGKNGAGHAFLDTGGTMTDLGTLSGYPASTAQAINAGGEVVGYATTSTGGTQAFLYSNGSMAGLGAPAGDAYSIAEAVNSGGQIVGYARPSTGSDHAFLYSNGTMTDLGHAPRRHDQRGAGDQRPRPGGRLLRRPRLPLQRRNDGRPRTAWSIPARSGPATSHRHQQRPTDRRRGQPAAGDSWQEHAVLLSPEFPGDANLDGKVDINDLTIVLTNFGQTGMSWPRAALSGDGTVDINDLTIVLANFGQSIGWHPPPVRPPCPNPRPCCWRLRACPRCWPGCEEGGNSLCCGDENQPSVILSAAKNLAELAARPRFFAALRMTEQAFHNRNKVGIGRTFPTRRVRFTLGVCGLPCEADLHASGVRPAVDRAARPE